MESIEKQTTPENNVDHLEISNEGVVDTREQMLSSIKAEEEAGTALIESMGGEVAAEAVFDKLPDEKKQAMLAKIEKLEGKVASSEAIVKGYGAGDNPLKGFQEIRQLLIKARISFLEKKL